LVKGTSPMIISEHNIAKFHTSAFEGKFKPLVACFGSWLNTSSVAYTVVPFFYNLDWWGCRHVVKNLCPKFY
jgi:hypothetical protein